MSQPSPRLLYLCMVLSCMPWKSHLLNLVDLSSTVLLVILLGVFLSSEEEIAEITAARCPIFSTWNHGGYGSHLDFFTGGPLMCAFCGEMIPGSQLHVSLLLCFLFAVVILHSCAFCAFLAVCFLLFCMFVSLFVLFRLYLLCCYFTFCVETVSLSQCFQW